MKGENTDLYVFLEIVHVTRVRGHVSLVKLCFVLVEQLLKYSNHGHFLFMLSSCGIIVCHMIGNTIRVDAMRPRGPYRRSSRSNDVFMFDRFVISSKCYIGSYMFSFNLPSKIRHNLSTSFF